MAAVAARRADERSAHIVLAAHSTEKSISSTGRAFELSINWAPHTPQLNEHDRAVGLVVTPVATANRALHPMEFIQLNGPELTAVTKQAITLVLPTVLQETAAGEPDRTRTIVAVLGLGLTSAE